MESESSNLNNVKWDKSSREMDGYKCQNLPFPESGALLGCMRSVMDEGPVNVSTEVSDRARTMEMKIDESLGTSIIPLPSVSLTCQLTERASTSDGAEPLMRPCHPDRASDLPLSRTKCAPKSLICIHRPPDEPETTCASIIFCSIVFTPRQTSHSALTRYIRSGR
jgi:hypothetical protein